MELQVAASTYEDFYIIEKGLSTNTYLGYRNDLKIFFNFLQNQGVKDTEEIHFQHIQEFLYQRSPQVTTSTLNREKSVIKNFLLYCLTKGEIIEDFSELLIGESCENFFPSVLTRDEMHLLFQHLENKKSESSSYQYRLAERDHLMLEMFYGLGLRVSEIISIQLKDIDSSGWCRISGKGDKIRNVPILPHTEKKIVFYLENIRPHFLPHSTLLSKLNKPENNNYLFLNKNGKKLSRTAVWKWVKRIAQLSGITKNISPHTFRHTCATHLLQNGADLRVIQELVGHSNIQTTELYTHLLTDDIKKTFADHHPLYHKK